MSLKCFLQPSFVFPPPTFAATFSHRPIDSGPICCAAAFSAASSLGVQAAGVPGVAGVLAVLVCSVLVCFGVLGAA